MECIDTPLVSIIIPVYNVNNYLRRCLDSVVGQTYQKLEIILVDDGSTDNSGKICDEYAQIDNRIIVVHKINGGLSDARNVGIDIASGKYIAFIDSDDFVSTKYIQILLEEIMKKNADIAICKYVKGSRDDFVKENNKKRKIKCFKSVEMLKNWHGKYKHVETVAWNKLYKLSLFKENNISYPQGYYNEDVQTTHLLINKADNIILIDEVLYYYFQRKDSITGAISEKKIEDNIYSQKVRMSFFSGNNYQDSYERLLIKLLKYYMLMFFETDSEKMKIKLYKKFMEEKPIVEKYKKLIISDKILFNLFEKNNNGLRKVYRIIKKMFTVLFIEHKKGR